MKKFAILLVLILLAAGLTGCQNDEEENQPVAGNTNTPVPGMTTDTANIMPSATDEAWLCSECGKESAGAFCSWCGAKKPDPIVCPGCGAEYAADSNFLFCNKCGASLTAAAQTAEPSHEPEEIRWIVVNVSCGHQYAHSGEYYNIITVGNANAPDDRNFYRYYRISDEDLGKLTIGGDMDFSLESLESES